MAPQKPCSDGSSLGVHTASWVQGDGAVTSVGQSPALPSGAAWMGKSWGRPSDSEGQDGGRGPGAKRPEESPKA